MVSFDDIKTVYDEIPLERLVENYEKRQRQAISQDSKQFNVFLAKFNQILNDKRIIPFYKTILHEIVRNISKEGYDYGLIRYFEILLEVSKPQTTDREVLTSLEWQMEQSLRKSYNEYSYEGKILLIFHIIFGKFDQRVQMSFIKLLKRFNYNSSMDLLVLMTSITKYHNGDITLERLEKDLEVLTTVNGIKDIKEKEIIVDTTNGVIPFAFASDCLGITDTTEFELGKCHFLVSDYLRELPNMSGVYYYIPNYFGGAIDHSVLVSNREGYVYDLSHNMAVPLEDFRRYYSSPRFSISSEEFRELSDRVREKYNCALYMHHLDEVGRSLKMIM